MKKVWVYIIITVLINIIFRAICRASVDFSEWYSTSVYPVIVNVFGFLSGLLPFSVIEIILLIISAGAVFAFIIFIIFLIKKKGGRKRIVLKALTSVFCSALTIGMIFLFSCEINYYRYPFSYYSGFSFSGYTADELRAVIDEINLKLHEISPNIKTAENGGFTFDNKKLNEISRSSMKSLAEIYPCLDTYYPQPKPVILSEFLFSRTLICGVYSPFTIEANYNNDMPDSEKPFTVCHELSHLNGFMREDETNFISFLACRISGDIDYLYSGYTRALVYAINAYYNAVDNDTYFKMYDEIPQQVKRELQLTNEYWKPFRDTMVSNISHTVNDTYLKANNQTDGTQSYGRFVDLLIAEYLSRQ